MGWRDVPGVLSIGKLTGPDSERYYTTSVAQGREDYYAGRGEAPGRWVGSATDVLMETDGEVCGEALGALLQGRSPTTGQALGGRPGARSVSGFDLTFSAPKTVSILFGTGDETVAGAARAAHDAAVDQALGYMEREACWTRRGFGGRQHVKGAGFVGAAYRHRTSRAGDPALHTHVVVGNVTRQPDGTWSALDGRHLYRHAKTAGYLYQAALRTHLSASLGVTWTATTNGMADVRGIPRTVIEHFSRRRAEILDRMQERGERSRRAAEVAALDTRRRKDYAVPADRLREEWRARAAEHGFGPTELADLLIRSERFPEEPLDRGRQPLDAHELTHEHAAFDRRDVLRTWAQQQRDGAPISEIERAADTWLASQHAVQLEPGKPGPWQPRFSTPEMLACERELLQTSLARRAEGAGRSALATVDDVLAQRRELSDEQAAMVRALTTSGDGVQVVRAAAGTGKTYALDATRQAWERAGLQVHGAALSAQAALELQDQSGIPSTTIAQLQIDLNHGRNLTPYTVLVIDEAGMVGTRDLAHIAHHADEMGAKLVLAGDDRQLPEIEAGGAFRALGKRLGAVELTEVRRQQNEWDRDALAQLRDGSLDAWAAAYREHGRLRGGHDAHATRAQLADDWYQATREHPHADHVMIAHRRSDVADLNQRARDRLRRAGELASTELQAQDRAFAEGDRVIACHNDRRAAIANSMRGTVQHVDHEHRNLTVRFDDGRDREITAAYLDEGHLDHGYALTAHRAQGTTVHRAFVLGSDDLYRELGYTALTRHRDSAHYYVNLADGQLALELDRDTGHDGDAALDPLRHSRTKTLATDLLREPFELSEPAPLGPADGWDLDL